MIKLLKQLRKRDWLLVVVSIFFIAFQVFLDLKLPDYMSKITTLVQTEGSTMADILLNGFYMLLCAFGSLLAAVITGYFIARIAANFSKNLRKNIFNKVGNFSLQEIKDFSTSSLITRTTNDVTQIEMLIAMGLQMLIKAPITAVWAITKILNKSWQWSAVTGVAVIILLSTIGILMTIILPRFKIVQKLIDKVNGLTRENLTGIRVVRAFNAEKFQEDKFEKTNADLTNLQLFNQKKLAIMQPMMYLVMYGLTLAIYFIGAYLIMNSPLSGKLTLFSDMVVFSSYAMQVIMSFLMLAMIFMILPRASVSAKRINEVLDQKIDIIDPDGRGATPQEVGTIKFNNVSFKYPDADEYILKNISFEVKKGETVAFLGSTGSGKSTLLNLVPRFYDATEGEVLVDGVNVKEYKQEDLKRLILEKIAKNVAKNIDEVGEIIIPQLEKLSTLSAEEKQVFIDSINNFCQEELDENDIVKIERQMQGEHKAEMEDLINMLEKLPRQKKDLYVESFVEQINTGRIKNRQENELSNAVAKFLTQIDGMPIADATKVVNSMTDILKERKQARQLINSKKVSASSHEEQEEER